MTHYILSKPIEIQSLLVDTDASFWGNEALLKQKVLSISDIRNASSQCLTVFHNPKYIEMFRHTDALLCITHAKYINVAPKHIGLFIHKNPYKVYALLLQKLCNMNINPSSYIAKSAYIANNAKLGKNVIIEHNTFIGENVTIADNCYIGPNCYIQHDVNIGENNHIENNVSIQHSQIGKNAFIKTGARIGQEGFGFASDTSGHYRIPHLGKVIIGNHVQIGANTCIDRGSLKNTIINDHCQIDNLVQIGHNVEVGKGSILVAQVGIAGSSKLGNFVTLAGQVGVSGHLEIADYSTVLAGSVVLNNVRQKQKVIGYPAISHIQWKRNFIKQKRSK